ncbi:hypothetical protein DVH24_004191 [Malus domestica]|uniref:Aminotransferase-like plant mobile domain-containing protein n=1 Tax=Malus domestica TaxID=3750 RepID=A0A498K5L1_MALDO|nr:hypothetical protein DVH24_004191 [Malus domestica]
MRNYVQRKEKREIGANRGTVTTQHWQRKFMNSGNEIEHKAFRVFWLRNYVFVCNRSMIYNDVISVAIHLARGTRITLTPAVLASIYRDLGVLKKAIVDSNQLESSCGAVSDLVIRSPFKLVQPYALDVVENWHLPEYYPQKEKWVSVGPNSGDELQSFVRCLRYYRALLSASGSYAIWIRSSSSFTQLKHKRYYTKETKKVIRYPILAFLGRCPHKLIEVVEPISVRKKHESSGIRQSSDREKLSGQVHKMVSPVAEECCVNTMKSDEGFVRIAGDGCASSTSLFEKKLLELKAGCNSTRLERMEVE